MIHETREEILERLWTLREDGKGTVGDVEALVQGANVRAEIASLVEAGQIVKRGETLEFTPRGEEGARLVIRRHRIAERLLVDLFDIRGDGMEEGACAFEHALSADVTASVCTFLGHPPLCPHGKPIPRGDCCEAKLRETRPVIAPLCDLEIGQAGRIVFMAPKFVDRIDRLSGLGIVPGSLVRLTQRRPACVIQADQTVLALDTEIAREIYVKRVEENSE